MIRRFTLWILLALLAAQAAPARPVSGGAPDRPVANGAPDRPRNLIVFFEFLENANGAEEAIAHVFSAMLRPGDRLLLQTPLGRYDFSPEALSRSRDELAAAMRARLRLDISKAARDYKQVQADLERLALELGEQAYPTGAIDSDRDLNELFMGYRRELSHLNQLRRVQETALRDLAAAFRDQPGETHLVVLFEREFRPIPRREALNVLSDMPVYGVQANELFATVNSAEPFDTAAMAEHFRLLPLVQHFVYVTSKSVSARGNLFENSGDVYSTFSRLAQASGGVTVTTPEPVEGLKEIAKTWESAK